MKLSKPDDNSNHVDFGILTTSLPDSIRRFNFNLMLPGKMWTDTPSDVFSFNPPSSEFVPCPFSIFLRPFVSSTLFSWLVSFFSSFCSLFPLPSLTPPTPLTRSLSLSLSHAILPLFFFLFLRNNRGPTHVSRYRVPYFLEVGNGHWSVAKETTKRAKKWFPEISEITIKRVEVTARFIRLVHRA